MNKGLIRHLFAAYSPAMHLFVRNGKEGNKNSLVQNLLGKFLGTNLSTAEQESNAFNAQQAQLNRDFQERMSNTEYQRSVDSMRAAGLNPSLMMAGNGSAVSAPSGSTASAVSPSSGTTIADLLSLAMLPAQIKNLNAQTENINANAALTRQRELTERATTRIQEITASMQYEYTRTEINSMLESIKNVSADTKYKESSTNLVDSQKAAQEITNKYLDERNVKELDKLSHESSKLSADERNAKATAWLTEIEAKFAHDNGFLMSSSDTLLIVTYIADLLGIAKSDVKEIVNNAGRYMREHPDVFTHFQYND